MLLHRKIVYLVLFVALAGLAAATITLQSPQVRTVHGRVVDTTGPVAGAVVRVRAASAYTLTDSDGRFTLAVPPAASSTQITAWAPGYFIGERNTADFGSFSTAEIMLHPHPTDDNPAYTFISPFQDMTDPNACAHCHRDRSGAAESTMPADEWRLDAHASSAVNPRFLSLYNGTTLDGAHGVPTVYRFDPAAGVNIPQMPSQGMDAAGPGYQLDYPEQAGTCAACHVPILALEAPYTADPTRAAGAAAEGVTCDFCHKIANVRLRPDGLPDPGLPGVLSYTFLRPHEGEQVFIGPFDDTPGEDIYSALQDESAFCAPCHSGQFWDVPIYDSYGEWLRSPYSDPETGQTCQDCHMPHVGATVFAQLPPDDPLVLPPRDPETIFSHRMPGAADRDLLAATAELQINAWRAGTQIRVTVRVTNTGAGHHIPTDNPLRNMILLVRAEDASGQALFLADGPTIPAWGGEGDPAQGYYAGLPGVLYAKILADFYTGETPAYAYWRQTRLVSDNRIPALESDETSYVFDWPDNNDTMTVSAQLFLRRAFIDLMAVKGWDTPDMLIAERSVRVEPRCPSCG